MLHRPFSLIRLHEKHSTHNGDLCAELMRCLISAHDHNSYVYDDDNYDDDDDYITMTTVMCRVDVPCTDLINVQS